MQTDISIVGMGSISPLGAKPEQVVHSYGYHDHLLVNKAVGDTLFPVGQLCEDAQQQIALLREESPKYKSLDPSVLYAIYAARQALAQAGWPSDKDFGVNIGSSRGATTLLEAYHKDFLAQGKCPPLASPTTSLGNIASWVMQDAKGQGIAISHSITCSTALHALVNAVAWLKADMAEAFLVGGSEAPLTPFTLAQMKALKIYADPCDPYPCQPLKQDKSKSTMALGEGAAVFALEKGTLPHALATIRGIGYATEKINHPVAISPEAEALERSMRQALEGFDPEQVDVVIPHATGTLKGDQAELLALEKVFGKALPELTTNKWKIGHTFAASGALAIEMAIHMFRTQSFFPLPYATHTPATRSIKNILINATGFGGNAVSVLIGKLDN